MVPRESNDSRRWLTATLREPNCARPIRGNHSRLRMYRTNDGEWWLVSEGFDVGGDLDFGGVFTLPVGPDCLRKHPEWKFAVVDN